MEELSNKEQVELLKKWWNDYGWSILLAVIIGVGVGYGWRYYKQYQVTHRVGAEEVYQKVLAAAKTKDGGEVVTQSQALVKQYPNTVYATLARLNIAKEYVQQQKYTPALSELKWVIAHADMSSLREIARLRATRVLIQQKDYKSATAMLKKVDDSAFLPRVKLLRQTIAQQG